MKPFADCCAIIPARRGSKGIPRKNVALVGGVPLVVRTVRAAKAAKLVDRIIVSTDDEEIISLVEKEGASVVQRPQEISGDEASSESALLHALEVLKQTEDYNPDIVVFLQCTSPFTTADEIDRTIELLASENADTAFTAAQVSHFLWRQGSDKVVTGINHDPGSRLRRQDADAQFQENGAVYAMKAAGFRTSKHRFFGRNVINVVPATHLVEIDEPGDLALARCLNSTLQTETLEAAFSGVKALVMDFDGVLTDDLVHVDQDGRESVTCSRRDGMGIEMLRGLGRMKLLILSREENPVVVARAKKLSVPCLFGIRDKLATLNEWMAENRLEPEEVAFVGNDINDLECMGRAGLSLAPADADPRVIRIADIVLKGEGGKGAIREIADGLVGVD